MKKFGIALVTAVMCGAIVLSFAACSGARGPKGELYDKALAYEGKQITEEQWNAARDMFNSEGTLNYTVDSYLYVNDSVELYAPNAKTSFVEEATIHYVCNQTGSERWDYEKRTGTVTYKGDYATVMQAKDETFIAPESGVETVTERYSHGKPGSQGDRNIIKKNKDGAWQEYKDAVFDSIVPHPLGADLGFNSIYYDSTEKAYHYSIMFVSSTDLKFDENGQLYASITRRYTADYKKITEVLVCFFHYEGETITPPADYIHA